MQLFQSKFFTYQSNELFCEGLNLKNLANDVGTPAYVYSKGYMQNSFEEFSRAFKSINHKIFYACKANYNINIIKLFNDFGAGIDVNSAGEFYRAQKAGVSPQNMIMSGVGKTADEIMLALENDIYMIKVESYGEIELVNKIAKSLGKVAPLAIRVNPNVDPATHPYISTGLAENKFGIDETLALDIFHSAANLPNIKCLGIDMHIGSQITKVEPYKEAVAKLVELVNQLKLKGINLSHIDIGGGMGVNYLDDNTFSAAEFANSIIPILSKTDCEIFLEPGRFLTANAGCLLSEVLYVKNNLDKNFLVVDAAMNDLLRPSIYKAYHHIQPISNIVKEEFVADIVGPVCESGDFLGKERVIKKCEPGEFLAIMSTGAYGMVMSSNYNARRRPVEVLVDGNEFSIIRERETFEQLIQNEQLI